MDIFKNIGLVVCPENRKEVKEFFKTYFKGGAFWSYDSYGFVYWYDGYDIRSSHIKDTKDVKIITVCEAKNMVRNHKIKLLLNV